MSLIPYAPDRSREIVLRHNSTVVLYDPLSKQLLLRSTSSNNEADVTRCPTCHRSFRDEESPHRADHGSNLPTSTSYMDPSYFRMLQHTLPEPQSTSRPTSPRRIDSSGTNRQPSNVLNTPPGAEFVASEPAVGQGISKRAFSPNYFRTFFKEERELGRGGKGVVLLVTHLIDTVSLGQFACKRVPVGDDHAWLEKVLIEVQTLQNLSHPNLVSYRHVWLEDFQISNFGPSVPCAFILQQYCNSGDLHHYVLGDTKTTLSPLEMKERMRRRSKASMDDFEDVIGPRRLGFEEIYSFFKDITSGLHHLHSHGFIHRDIKPQNCLLNRTGGRIQILLSDFGEVQVSNAQRTGTGATGTVSYCAPETLRQSPRQTFGNFTVKSDVFSVGMIVHFLSFGGLPYVNADDVNEENEDVEKLRAEIVAWPGFDDDQRRGRNDLPEILYKFLKRLLAIDPDERPSTEDILRMIRAAQDQISDSDLHNPAHGDGRNPRISVAESPSPYPRVPYRRKSSTSQQRPALRPSKLAQSTMPSSHDASTSDSSRKATVQDDTFDKAGMSSSHDPSSTNSAIVPIRNTNVNPSNEAALVDNHITTNSRLALPPPPRHMYERLVLSFLPFLRVALFILKYWSITAPCSPLSPRSAIAYPLILLAALDFMSPQFRAGWSFFLSRSFYLLLAHVAIISWTQRTRALCEIFHPFE